MERFLGVYSDYLYALMRIFVGLAFSCNGARKLFGVFGGLAQPMFMQVQMRLSALNTILQENLAGIRVVKHGNRSATSQCGSADVIERVIVTPRGPVITPLLDVVPAGKG